MLPKNLKGEDLGVCVCGQSIFADTTTGAVMHGWPPCKKFLELEPTEFLTYVRRSRGIPDTPGRRITWEEMDRPGSL